MPDSTTGMIGLRPWRGIALVTGDHDVGKTTFALEAFVDPTKVWFFDDDIKGRETVKQIQRDNDIKFGRYVDLVELHRGKKEVEFHKAVMSIIKEIPSDGSVEGIVWDTWTGFEGTFHPYVVANPMEFRTNWNPKGDIKGAQQWLSAREYEASTLSLIAEKAGGLVVVTHLKPLKINGVPVPGKKIMAVASPLERIPQLRLWLRRNPDGRGVPLALVLKRLDRKKLVPGKGLRTMQVLPQRLVPREDENSLWDTIERFWLDPVGTRSPLEEEIPTEFELSLIDGSLTPDQQSLFRELLARPASIDQGEDDVDFMNSDVEFAIGQVQSAMDAGATAPADIAAKTGLSIPEVLKALKSLKE